MSANDQESNYNILNPNNNNNIDSDTNNPNNGIDKNANVPMNTNSDNLAQAQQLGNGVPNLNSESRLFTGSQAVRGRFQREYMQDFIE